MEKQILVTIPLEDTQKRSLEEVTVDKPVRLLYKSALFVKDEDLLYSSAIIGNIPPHRLKICSNLEWMQLNSAGAAEFTEPGVLPDSCILTNAAGAYGLAVSEHMLALTFALIRRLGQYGRNQVSHKWKSMGNITSVENATTVILGLGDIGGSYARKMKALGSYTIGFRRFPGLKPEYLDEQYTLESLDQVLPRADIVAIALPGIKETYHLIDSQRISHMKEGAFLINVGRGNIIDSDALKTTLASGRLGGAGLDVTEPEPLPEDDPLWDYDNVIITPHVAGHFFLRETLERIVLIAKENLKAYVDNGEFSHIVNRARGY